MNVSVVSQSGERSFSSILKVNGATLSIEHFQLFLRAFVMYIKSLELGVLDVEY